jgi:hypothetical protein
MTPDAFRRFALALPEAREEPHFERTSFRVGKRIFATLARDGSEAMIKLPVAEEAVEWVASRPELFLSYGAWTERNGALGVRLAKAPARLLGPLLIAAWRALAPKRALAAYEGSKDGR